MRLLLRWGANCSPADITLASQNDVDNFQATYGGGGTCDMVTGNALQLMGGYGYSKEYPMERRFRDAWGWGIAGGAIDIQKINIASALIGRRFDQRA